MKQGKPTKASLEHLVFYPNTTRTSYPTIIGLHGRGTNEHDLLPLIELLDIPDALVIEPRAPFLFNLGGLTGGYVWYELGEEGIPDPTTFRKSIKLLSSFLQEIKEAYPVDPSKVLLLGFSQGTVMAYAVGLGEPDKIHGIAALSGYVPHRSGLPLRLRNLNELSVFISHGAWDEMIPVEFGRESAQLLRTAGADVVYHEYQMGHEVSEETLRDLNVWGRNLMD
jgi:phospholipase/carboxylesterase